MESKKRAPSDMLVMGSWHVYNRLTLDEGIALVKGAIELGITHFDVVDYWDCGILTTIRFKEIMKALGVSRDKIVIGVKAFPNSVDSRDDLVRRDLERLEIDYVDYVLCSRPTQGESIEHAAECMSKLVDDGLTKELDMTMWDPAVARETIDYMKKNGLHTPKCMQFPYNICRRDVVESDAYVSLFKEGLKLQAGFTMEGGIFAGHTYRKRFDPEDKAKGIWFPFGERNLTRDHGGIREKIVAAVPHIRELAESAGLTPSQFALGFVATNPYLDSIVFGATKVWQIEEAIKAVEFAQKEPELLRKLADEVGVSGTAIPGYFDYGRFKL